MSEPTTEAGRALEQSFREMCEHQTYIKPPARFISTGRDAILAIEAEARATEREAVRERVSTAFDEYLWGLSISPQPASGPCQESVTYFRDQLLASITESGQSDV